MVLRIGDETTREDAPAFGNVARYEGFIWNLERFEAWAFETEEQEWAVPPGILIEGPRYHLEVFARDDTGLFFQRSVAITEPFSP